MRRPLVFLVLALVFLPGAVRAAATPPPSAGPTATATAGGDVQNGGVIEGTVTAVDYQKGTLNVDTGKGGVEVALMPSTSVQSSDPGYHAISDVSKGSRVQIFTSKSAGRLIAQIIRLIKR